MPNVSAQDAAIYTANDFIKALTKPQPTNYQLAALQQLATIFQSSITNKPVSVPGVPVIVHNPNPPPPPNFPELHHQQTSLSAGGASHCT